MISRVDEIIRLLVSEALDLERKTNLDFVGALNNVQLSVSAKVMKIMEARRMAERLHADATLKRKIKKEKKDA